MTEPTTPRRAETIDELLTVLADAERRAILAHLEETQPGDASLETLAAVLASGSHAEHETASIRLHHIHLPKLDETPLLSYDPETTTVEYHGHSEPEFLLETILHSNAHP